VSGGMSSPARSLRGSTGGLSLPCPGFPRSVRTSSAGPPTSPRFRAARPSRAGWWSRRLPSAATWWPTIPARRVIHGNLHYSKVLAADHEPWVVIGPKPMNGD
jgi:hypothetical protein